MRQWLDQFPVWVDYLIILLFSGVIYQTTFAQPLPLLKNLMVYVALAIGSYLLLIFHILGFPIIPSLLIAVGFIIVTRLRLWLTKKGKERESNETR